MSNHNHWAIGLLFLFIGVVGCEHPAHRERIAMRENNLKETTEMLAEMEASRSEKLERTLAMLQDWCRDDLVKSRRAAVEALEWLHDDVTRWQRNEQHNRELIENLNRGNIQNIEETIPVILY